MNDYDLRAQQTAHRSLKPKSQGGKGQEVQIISSIPGAYDPATGTSGPAVPVVQRGCGIELAYKASEIDGTQVMKGDKKFMLSALDVFAKPIIRPSVGQRHQMAGKPHRIEAVEAIEPAGTPVFFYLQLRDA